MYHQLCYPHCRPPPLLRLLPPAYLCIPILSLCSCVRQFDRSAAAERMKLGEKSQVPIVVTVYSVSQPDRDRRCYHTKWQWCPSRCGCGIPRRGKDRVSERDSFEENPRPACLPACLSVFQGGGISGVPTCGESVIVVCRVWRRRSPHLPNVKWFLEAKCRRRVPM